MRYPLWMLAVLALFTTPSAFAEQPKSADPIHIITNDWTSQIVLAHITGSLFKTMGYNVTYTQSTTNEQWGALAAGVEHVQVEVWEGTMSDMFNRMVKAKRITDAGTHDAQTREDWWYPDYVEEQCPGLPDWQALKRCAPMFSNSDSSPSGAYIAGPWEKPEAARIRALGMDFKVQAVKNSDDLWVALAEAYKQKKPIVLFNWTPNWVEARYAGKFIEFPDYAPECETDPAWGINPDFHHDCGNPKNGWLKKAAWSGMQKKWNCAFQALTNMNFNNAMISHAAAQVDVDKMSYEEAANAWINANSSLWKSWIPTQCSS